MKIIITNDDGYEAKGLQALTGIMRPFGNLTVVAPKAPQSGMSMAVSMGHRPIAVRKLSEEPGLERWYLDGTPASCVKFALDNILWPQNADLVVSGINHGNNAATAAIYSGTIGAAMEGAVNGVPSIGVSLDNYDPDADFSAIERMLPSIIERILAGSERRFGQFYNVNFPALPYDKIKGIRFCHMGRGHWEREYRPYAEFLAESGKCPDEATRRYLDHLEDGESVFVMAGDFTDNGDNVYPADHQVLEEGYVTITPHNIDNTDRQELRRLCDTTL